MKHLSATMIPTNPILPFLCAPNGWSLIDTRDTCAVCESHLGRNRESQGALGYEPKLSGSERNMEYALALLH